MSIGLENSYRGTNVSTVSVRRSGWVEMYVSPLEDVTAGQSVGTVYNSWGDVIQNLTAAVAGRVLTVRVDAAVEQGAGVLDIAYNATASS